MILRRPAPDAVPSEALDTTAWLGLSGRRGWASRAPLRWRLSLVTGVVVAVAVAVMTFFNLLVGCSVDDGERR